MDKDAIAQAIRSTLISPNVSDSNSEPANIVDALDRIGDALHRIANALYKYSEDNYLS